MRTQIEKISQLMVFVGILGFFSGLLAQEKPEIQPDTGFRSADYYDTKGEVFDDDIVDEIIMLFDKLLSQPSVKEDFAAESRIHFWRFTNRLSKGILSDEQLEKVNNYVDGLKQLYPDAVERIDKNSFVINNLMLGRKAPNITGEDENGNEIELNDYLGKITVLYFTGNWCGPCRGEYPFQRFMLEYFKDDPFAIVAVNSDPIEVAKVYKKENGLEYSSFWDGGSTKGPISTRWNVTGWPTIYIFDDKGTIRNKNTRMEKLITVVRDLINEKKWAEEKK